MEKTSYGEACGQSPASWEAIANVIMNRVGRHDWKMYTRAVDIVTDTGFEACSKNNPLYVEAEEYLLGRIEKEDCTNELIENMIQTVVPVLRGEKNDDITKGCVFYYSPKKQKENHEKDPAKYRLIPSFLDTPELEEVKIESIGNDDFAFFRFLGDE